jgi:type I restriction enzyme R subunit
MTKEPNWIQREFSDHPIRTGRTIEDPDFPRIAITYSLQENEVDSADNQNEMKKIIKEYNQYYNSSWAIDDIDRYNGDINNRLARKRAEFKEFGKQVDLVIVVDRLLTGFDAPTIQTLFVDRNLSYANLIQAFSRTNRTYPNKTKGLIVSFRKPHTMEKNVAEATRLYSEAKEEMNLIYPDYEKSRKKFNKGHKRLAGFISDHPDIRVESPIDQKIEFVKAFQELNNSFEALVTYDDYNNDMEKSKILKEQVMILEENLGLYHTIKGSLVEPGPIDPIPPTGLSEIEFYSDNPIKLYDIDSTYIDQLLNTYSAHNKNVRDDIEKAMQKLNKSEIVREVYRSILNDIDSKKVDPEEDIFALKRRYFTTAQDLAIEEFANSWFVSENELHSSAVQYVVGMNPIPNIGSIIDSLNFEEYKSLHPNTKKFQYGPEMKREWRKALDEVVVPLDNELR